MLGDAANHAHNSVALDDLALIADLLNTSSNFHDLFFLARPSLQSLRLHIRNESTRSTPLTQL